ncbi:hypothetical protein [Lysobacter xanthus]
MAISRFLAPAVLAAAFGAASFAPAAQAQSYDLTRAIVDIADVVFRGNQPYYRNGDYSQDDRLVAGRDRYGRTVYYRVQQDPRYGYDTRTGRPPYGNAYGYYGRNASQQRRVKCNKHGKCKTEYYDPRYDQRSYGDRYGYGYGRDD